MKLYSKAFHHASYDLDTEMKYEDDELINIISNSQHPEYLKKVLQVTSFQTQLKNIWYNDKNFLANFFSPEFLLIMKEMISGLSEEGLLQYCERGISLENGKFFNSFCPGNNNMIPANFDGYMQIIDNALKSKVDEISICSSLKEIGLVTAMNENLFAKLCEYAIAKENEAIATAILRPHEKYSAFLDTETARNSLNNLINHA